MSPWSVCVAVPGRIASSDALDAAGARLTTISATEHDRISSVVQVGTHALLLGFATMLNALNCDIPTALSLSTPPHRLLVSLIHRITMGDPLLYWDIQHSHPLGAQMRLSLSSALTALSARIENGDRNGFVEEFQRTRERLTAATMNLGDMSQAVVRAVSCGPEAASATDAREQPADAGLTRRSRQCSSWKARSRSSPVADLASRWVRQRYSRRRLRWEWCSRTIREDRLREAVQWFTARQLPIHGIVLDVTDREAYARAADEAESVFGPVQLLCNTAGVGQFGPIESATYDDWDWQIDVNLKGVINGIATFVPRMIRRAAAAHIVNTASMSAFFPMLATAIYATTKYAVRGLSDSLRVDLEGHDIGVSSLPREREHEHARVSAGTAGEICPHRLTIATIPRCSALCAPRSPMG